MNNKEKVINIIHNNKGLTIQEIINKLSISNHLQKQKIIILIKTLQKELKIEKKGFKYYLKNNNMHKKKCIDDLKTLNWSVYLIINKYLDLQEKYKKFFIKLDNDIEHLVTEIDKINTQVAPLLN